MVHCDKRASLGTEAIVGRRDRLLAIRNIRGYVHLELKFTGVTLQPGRSNVGLYPADCDRRHWRQTPGLRNVDNVNQSLVYYIALKNAKGPVEMPSEWSRNRATHCDASRAKLDWVLR